MTQKQLLQHIDLILAAGWFMAAIIFFAEGYIEAGLITVAIGHICGYNHLNKAPEGD